MINVLQHGSLDSSALGDVPDIARLACGEEGEALSYLAHCPMHRPTALVNLPGLADLLGVAAIHVKDESTRLGLGSFKSLGGAYAVIRIIHEEANIRLARDIPVADLLSPPVRDIAASMIFVCATDGNHGRSLAAGARLMGATSTIFVHEGVSKSRVDAIRDAGAVVHTIAGNYDDAVDAAREAAAQNGWCLVSDTSWPGYQDVPRRVMQGYLVIAAECWEQVPAQPTHIFLQAGVGGFAAAMAAHAVTRWPENPPHIIIVEPSRAACLMASARAGSPVTVDHCGTTIMGMLECFAPSLVAFNILKACAHAFITVDDEDAVAAMRRLANPVQTDQPIVAGESGAAGVAALLALAKVPDQWASLGLTAEARILLFNTEGATDPTAYHRIVQKEAATLSNP
jgi:diaminopropionate ammonia-lyase